MAPGIFILFVVALVAAFVLWRSFREVTVIYAPSVGLLYRDGQFVRELPPGRYVRFDPFKRTKVVKLSLAEMPAQLAETTVLSKDQFSFRLGLAPILKIVDAKLFNESQPTAEPHGFAHFMPYAATHAALQPLVAAAATEAVATRNLAEILADATSITQPLEARLAEAIPGARVDRVLLTGINLPPETRKMFTDVERARMEGQAGLERARGEHAALRVLANAARLITDNPALANLRLLQAVESSKGATTIVIGNPAGLPVLEAAAPGSATRTRTTSKKR